MTENSEANDFWQVLLNLYERWYLLAILGLLGALTGFLVSLGHPPQYEATAVSAVGFNYDEPVPGDQYGIDLALGKVAAVVSADDVLEGVLERYHLEEAFPGQPLDLAALRGMLVLERKGPSWEFKARGEDPLQLAWLATAWMEEAEQAYQDAHFHAVRAKNLAGQMAALNAEIGLLVSGAEEEVVDPERLEYLEGELARLEESFHDATTLARGLVTFISFGGSQAAQPVDRPLVHRRGEFILVGALLGLTLAVSLALAASKMGR
jgi:hypothetical protein